MYRDTGHKGTVAQGIIGTRARAHQDQERTGTKAQDHQGPGSPEYRSPGHGAPGIRGTRDCVRQGTMGTRDWGHLRPGAPGPWAPWTRGAKAPGTRGTKVPVQRHQRTIPSQQIEFILKEFGYSFYVQKKINDILYVYSMKESHHVNSTEMSS